MKPPILKWMPLMLCSSLALSGCGLFQDGYYYDRNDEYRDAQMSEPLVLPSSRSQIRYQDSMPVPASGNDFAANDAESAAPRPQSISSGRSGDRAYVEDREADGERWLVVDAAPASVWPQLQGFVSDHGVSATSINAASGRIQTDQGALSLRQGLRGGTSEVRCDIGSSAQCLSAVKAYLEADDGADSGVSLAAQPLAQAERVQLVTRDDQWQLRLALDSERAWSELLYQLQNAFDAEQLVLTDQNRSTGQFLIDYRPQDDEGGSWFGWVDVFDWFGEDEDAMLPAVLQLRADGASSVLVAGDRDGEELPTQVSHDLLDAIAATLR